jgi:hypothetical protein
LNTIRVLFRLCPEGYVCLPSLNDNPDDGWTNFDNIFNSMLSTFQLITLDYWERLYELVSSRINGFMQKAIGRYEYILIIIEIKDDVKLQTIFSEITFLNK